MSAYAFTANYQFKKIDYGTRGWHTEEYANWDLLDALLATLSPETVPFAVATGAVNTYAVNYTPDVAYAVGLVISFTTNAANTGPATINADGLGAKDLYRNGAALVSGDLASGVFVKAVYDGTRFHVIEPRSLTAVIADGSIGHAKLSTGKPTWDASSNLTVGGNAAISGNVVGNAVYEGSRRSFVQNDSVTFPSNRITFSTADPSGGSDGDIWIKHAA